MSIAGGIHLAPARGVEVGCEALQVFTRSNVRWSFPELDPAEADAFRDAVRQSGLRPVIAHGCYLVNLASANVAIRRKSYRTLLDELRRCHALGIGDLVIHPGSHPAGTETGIRLIADGLNRVLGETLDTRVLLETTAGQGTQVGAAFEELRAIIDLIEQQERIGVCVDTCHVFAAGYDIRTEHAYCGTFELFDSIVGIGRIRAFHVNDSKRELGSRVDRHQHIGRGHLGTDAFRLLLHDRRFRDLPMIIETPKKDDDGTEWDEENIALLKKLRDEGMKR